MREHAGPDAVPVEMPRSKWRFPDASHVQMDGGFTPGALYEVVYRSADSPVVGLGFLAIRDTAAWLRWAPAASGNPLAGTVERAYLFGVSQSGRFLRNMLYLGLDEDEQGRMVFDAVLPHVAGGRRGEFNLRFGQPSLNAQQSVGSLPPFLYDDLLARARQRGRVPKIVAINTSAEYWRGDASLIHTDNEGRRDVDLPDFARAYLFAGTQHGAGRAAAARGGSQYRQPRVAALQHQRLRASPARGARQPRPLGERGRGAARERVSAARRRHGGDG